MAQWLFDNTYSFTYSLFPSLFEVFCLFFLMLGPPKAIFWTSALAIIFKRCL